MAEKVNDVTTQRLEWLHLDFTLMQRMPFVQIIHLSMAVY